MSILRKGNGRSIIFAFPFALWMVSGYPLRQILSKESNLLIPGICMLLAAYLLFILILGARGRIKPQPLSKAGRINAILWAVFLSLGLISSSFAGSESVFYQGTLIAGAILMFAECYFGLLPLRVASLICLAVVIPFHLLWLLARLGHVWFPTYTIRNASYGVISLSSIAAISYLIRRPYNFIVEATILASLLINGHRTSFLAAFVFIMIQSAFYLRKGRIKRSLKGLIIAGTCLVAVASFQYYERAADYVANKVLFWNDVHRGYASGFSNRIATWQTAFPLISEKPILGWGSHENENIVRDREPTASSAHNGILASFIDYGIIGGSLGLLLLAHPLILAGKRAWSRGEREFIFISAYGIGYIVLSLGERYWFNVGNPTSLMMLYSIFYTLINIRKIRAVANPVRVTDYR